MLPAFVGWTTCNFLCGIDERNNLFLLSGTDHFLEQTNDIGLMCLVYHIPLSITSHLKPQLLEGGRVGWACMAQRS
jgi:hypothetical protein